MYKQLPKKAAKPEIFCQDNKEISLFVSLLVL